MFLFGDVWTLREACRYLAEQIEKGLAFQSVKESKKAYLHSTDEGYEACILSIALIGHRGSIMVATEVLDQEAHEKFDGQRRILEIIECDPETRERVKGVSEIAARVVRWSLEGLGAAEVVSRLRSV
jgi:hypothetical protein